VSHILFAAFGSAGDVFPAIAVGRRLQARKHRVTMLAPPSVSLYARTAGLSVATIGDGTEMRVVTDGAMFTNRFDGFSSWRRTSDQYLYPIMRDHYRAARATVERVRPDVVVVHPLAPFGSLIAAELGIPWISLHLYPQLVPSTGTRSNGRGSRRGCGFGGRLPALVRGIEEDAGLRPSHNPLLDWGWSPLANLSVHDPAVVASTVLATQSVGEPCGFPYWDDVPFSDDDHLAVEQLLVDRSGPLLVATLGSFIGQTHRRFWIELAGIVADLGWSAVLVGVPAALRRELERRRAVRCLAFYPMSRLSPHADVLLHHGGIGTTYAGLFAGKPVAVIPQAFDQSFNARLVTELGVGSKPTAASELSETLKRLGEDAECRLRAEQLAARLVSPALAADALAARILDCIEDKPGAPTSVETKHQQQVEVAVRTGLAPHH
jgi:rhamnosyltransferase subunit B